LMACRSHAGRRWRGSGVVGRDQDSLSLGGHCQEAPPSCRTTHTHLVATVMSNFGLRRSLSRGPWAAPTSIAPPFGDQHVHPHGGQRCGPAAVVNKSGHIPFAASTALSGDGLLTALQVASLIHCAGAVPGLSGWRSRFPSLPPSAVQCHRPRPGTPPALQQSEPLRRGGSRRKLDGRLRPGVWCGPAAPNHSCV